MLASRFWRRWRLARRLTGIHLLSVLLPVFLPLLLKMSGPPMPPPIQTVGPATACAPMPPFGSAHDRFGVNVIRDYGKDAADYDMRQTRAGWYLDYTAVGATNNAAAYVRVLRVSDLLASDWRSTVSRHVTESPGAIWFIGNETDRYSQDGILADEYARIYHRTYSYIKQLDPTATVGNAAIIQATPIRLRYLDAFLSAYRAAYGSNPPIDYWNIHNFILREELGDWGASIPPGFEEYNDEGMKFELWDHGDIELFKSQIITFRRWMADNGYRHVPLTVSEYGILMPADYIAEEPPGTGTFDYPLVRQFMLDSFDFFLTATDPEIGHPEDENRLVQSWAWFSLNDREYSQETEKGSNGNLLDHDTGAMTQFGQDFAAYIAPLYLDYRDLTVRSLQVTPATVTAPDAPGPIEFEIRVQNRGTLAAGNATVKLYWEREDGGRELIGERVLTTVAPRCAQTQTVRLTWQPDMLPLGFQQIVAEVVPAQGQPERIVGNESASAVLYVSPQGAFSDIYLPLIRSVE